MYPISPQELFEQTQEFGGAVALVQGKMAGLVKRTLLNADPEIYEYGSFFVLPEFRGKGIGHHLVQHILDKHPEKPMLAITNVPAVISINQHIPTQSELLKTDISSELLEIIEWPQKLLPDDRIFANPPLQAKIMLWNHLKSYFSR